MRYLLDTNVLSEVAKPQPDPAVVSWLSSQSRADLAISSLVLGEISSGVAGMPDGDRRTVLEAWLASDLPDQFRHRVLPIDAEVSLTWGRLTAEGRRAGRPLPVVDGLMLATAQTHGLTLVTRNMRDCSERGVTVLDPWAGVTR